MECWLVLCVVVVLVRLSSLVSMLRASLVVVYAGASRDDNGDMHIVVRVVLDGWTPSEPALVKNIKVNGSKDIPVTEDGFVDPENVLEEIAKVVGSIPTDYHYYMD